MDPETSIKCDECDAKITVRVSEIARGATKTCPNGHTFKLVDKTGGARQAQKAAEDFQRKMRDLGFR